MQSVACQPLKISKKPGFRIIKVFTTENFCSLSLLWVIDPRQRFLQKEFWKGSMVGG